MHKDFSLPILPSSLQIRQIIGSQSSTPTLVFLHEGLGCIEMWKDFPDRLCQQMGWNGLLYDRRGYGKSDSLAIPRSRGYLEEEAVEILPELLKKLNIQQPILIGHSDGGTIALLYAAHFPHTQAIITEAAHIYVEPITLEGMKVAVQQLKRPEILAKLRRYHGEKAESLLRAWAEIWLSPGFRDWNISAALPNIQCPSLLIQGDKDEYATPQHLWDIAKGIGPKAKALLLKGLGHNPHGQDPEIVLPHITSFLHSLSL